MSSPIIEESILIPSAEIVGLVNGDAYFGTNCTIQRNEAFYVYNIAQEAFWCTDGGRIPIYWQE
ncbi:MAG TPA: hypothetical protein PLY62_09175 [Bacteroidales bacterium]|nr:hypothetical protein [Bacteroidales bacterium]